MNSRSAVSQMKHENELKDRHNLS